ncbi:MAG: serine/threonine protein kinase, partial [Candidatus Eisenbacteria bacterium]|nr:serine/threonine protein kinase [Candidatus Eisenbacteria bacterium]
AAARDGWLASARRALALRHPHIVATLDVCDTGDMAFVAMEIVGRRTLRERVEHGPVPLRETLATGRAVAAALAFAHGLGVLHADLKPENVLLAANGAAKVADFCTQAVADGGPRTLDATPEYMAPETALGRPPEAATDAYGLGLLLYEMISGHPPFGGAQVAAVATRVASEPPPPLPAATPTALQELIEALLAMRPADRPRAAEAADRLAAMGGA